MQSTHSPWNWPVDPVLAAIIINILKQSFAHLRIVPSFASNEYIYMTKGTLGSSAKFHEVFPLIFQTQAEPYSFVYVSESCRHHMSCPTPEQRAITVRNLLFFVRVFLWSLHIQSVFEMNTWGEKCLLDRGCSHITSAKNRGSYTPPPPSVSNGQHLAYPPSPLVSLRQHFPAGPIVLQFST